MNPNESDHDILIELRGDVKALRGEVQEIKDTTKTQLKDHEARIRMLEHWGWSAVGILYAVVTIIGWILIVKFNNR